MGAMNESFVSVHNALDHAIIREGEFLSLQKRLEERESHIKPLKVLERNEAAEISKLKEEVKRLEGKLRSHDQGIEALMVDRAVLINQVMSWEAEAITTRDSFKEAELLRSENIANVVDEALAKFKSSNEFYALLKKDHDTGFDAGV